jgi:hypothetical protein
MTSHTLPNNNRKIYLNAFNNNIRLLNSEFLHAFLRINRIKHSEPVVRALAMEKTTVMSV